MVTQFDDAQALSSFFDDEPDAVAGQHDHNDEAIWTMQSLRHHSITGSINERIYFEMTDKWKWYHKRRAVGVRYRVGGKYLFFSPSFDMLEEMAIDEMEQHDFYLAKVSLVCNPDTGSHLLCLYSDDGSYAMELRNRYLDNEFVRFATWKSEADSKSDKYADFCQRFRRTSQ